MNLGAPHGALFENNEVLENSFPKEDMENSFPKDGKSSPWKLSVASSFQCQYLIS